MSTPDDAPRAATPAATPDRARNPVGRAALIVALVLVTVGSAQQVLAVLAPVILARQGLSISAYGLLLAPGGIAVGLLGVAAVILGILGLTRPASPREAAAAGLAIGANALLALLISPLAGLIASAV
ncbi:MAG: hypothetical protein HY996_09770 [Micrococcales bacterium]|nr:hypothetical protein [Micrococcales bacterium]